MNRYIIFAILVGVSILIMGLYNFLSSDGAMVWNREEELDALNTVQKEWLKEKKTLVIGVTDASVPLLYFDDSGNPQGLLKDYMERIEEGYGIRLQYLPVLAKDLETMLENKDLDTAISTRNPEQDQNLEFTMPIVKTKGIL